MFYVRKANSFVKCSWAHFEASCNFSLFGGGGGAGGCKGDPTGEAVSLEGLVHYQREGLPLYLVRRCSIGALQWLQRLVQVHPGREAGHHVLQRESRGGLRQLWYRKLTTNAHSTHLQLYLFLWLISRSLHIPPSSFVFMPIFSVILFSPSSSTMPSLLFRLTLRFCSFAFPFSCIFHFLPPLPFLFSALFFSPSPVPSSLLVQSPAVSSWRSCSEQGVRWNQWRPVSPSSPVWVLLSWQWATGLWPVWRRVRSPSTTQMDSRPPSWRKTCRALSLSPTEEPNTHSRLRPHLVRSHFPITTTHPHKLT